VKSADCVATLATEQRVPGAWTRVVSSRRNGAIDIVLTLRYRPGIVVRVREKIPKEC
jgi:hypothetical protein